MDDNKIFETHLTKHKLSNVRNDKFPKYLLKKKYQEILLKKSKLIAQKLLTNPKVDKVYIGGSVAQGQLGKYSEMTCCGIYSDIDIYAFLNCKIGDIYPKKLRELGLTRKHYVWNGKKKVEKFYNTFKADKNGKPLFLMERFPVGVWLISKYTLKKEMKLFPKIFDDVIKFEKSNRYIT